MNLKNYIKTLKAPSRGDCPQCGGKNTFSISLVGGYRLYNCFRASCNLQGKIEDAFQIDAIMDAFYSSNVDLEYRKSQIFQNIGKNILDKYSYLTIINNLGLAKYDPKLNRLVFLLNYENENFGAVGKYLGDNLDVPKWYVYERREGCPFILHKSYDKCILVEDCLSAVNCYSICSSIALLGTNIPDNAIPYFVNYKTIWIALDDDATAKAVKLQRELAYTDAKILPLTKDLKYYSKEELMELDKLINGSKTIT